jgi:spermidine synthase
MYLDAPTELVGDYSRFFLLAAHFRQPLRRILLLGGGAYSIPKYFLERYPGLEMDVVEIDPGLTELARRYFHLKENNRLRIFHEDARTYLSRSTERYDAIFVDVFSSSPSVPFQLTTLEAMRLMQGVLNDDGVILANVISGIDGDTGRYLRAQLKTLREIFPHVLVFPVSNTENAEFVQNIMIAALSQKDEPVLKNSDPELMNLLSQHWSTKIAEDIPVLRDEFAPVEHYMMSVFIQIQKQTSSNPLERYS